MSLRQRVVLGCLAVAVVLLAADAALASTFRGFLLERIDEQLTESAGRFADFAVGGAQPPRPDDDGRRGGDGFGGPGPGGPREPLSEFYVGLSDANGYSLQRIGAPLRSDQQPPEPSPAQVVSATVDRGQRLRPFTVDGGDGEGWRMVALRAETKDIVVVGASLASVGPTYDRMILVLVVATLAVFAMLVGVAWWVLRQGVRPLTAMTATAEAIAGDALHARVLDADERTEAGRLAIALNTMLERLQGAFAERAASEQRLRRFVADASHELRTPLTSIRGYAELYRTGALAKPDDLDSAMRRVEQEGQRMGALVEDLLLLAKLDQGRPLELSQVDLSELVRDAVADLKAVQPQRAVDVQTEAVVVEADDARLRQAIGNLLTNVRDHTLATTPVRVSVRADGTEAIIEVADDGPGMPPDVAARVFERFYRADHARARTSGGAGLGLSIVAGIAEAHGGRVEVVSMEGSGACFRIRLPAGAA